jgi:mono/diheme cytochrome c family protein
MRLGASLTLLVLSLCDAGIGCGGAVAGTSSSSCRAAITDARVADIVTRRCATCHSQNGSAGPDNDWTDLAKLRAARRGVAARVRSGAMPPVGSPRLLADDRDALVAWAECELPNPELR